MSVTFSLAGDSLDLDDGATYLNLCNTNAVALLEAVQLPVDEYGEIPVAELAAVRRQVLFALNVPGGRQCMLRETEAGTGTGGAAWFSAGLDDADAKDRLERFLALVIRAQERGKAIVWG